MKFWERINYDPAFLDKPLEVRAVAPAPDPTGIFQADFLTALRALVNVHHSIYRTIPPQGIYFEALVREAFHTIKKPYTLIKPGGVVSPGHDLLVEDKKISLKTETGAGTKSQHIAIMKLCTTEREPWTAPVLVERVMEHLTRYDIILILRAVWEKPILHYQLLEIPISLLRLIETAQFEPVGKRKGRQSLGADVLKNGEVLYHVHFDGSDGKCQIRNLHLRNCVNLLEWDLQIRD